MSLEALKEVQRNLTSLESGESHVVVEKRSTGWRLRYGTKEHRRHGPTRKDKAEAEEDARRVSAACSVSPHEVERIFESLFQHDYLALEKHGGGWRLRCGTKEHRRYGPTRLEEAKPKKIVVVSVMLSMKPKKIPGVSPLHAVCLRRRWNEFLTVFSSMIISLWRNAAVAGVSDVARKTTGNMGPTTRPKAAPTMTFPRR